MDAFSLFLVYIVILLLSVVVHEVSHGAVANMLGDPTARLMGRLTLNPLPHIDPVGSVLLPLILFMFSAPFVFAWAKPVPFNPYNLHNPRRDSVLIAAAGPVSNLIIAAIFGLTYRVISTFFSMELVAVDGFLLIVQLVVALNVLLVVFNLIPIPPLDGSKFLFWAFPNIPANIIETFERLGILLVFAFLFLLGGFFIILPIMASIFSLLTSLPPSMFVDTLLVIRES